jgi:hypothetical protein
MQWRFGVDLALAGVDIAGPLTKLSVPPPLSHPEPLTPPKTADQRIHNRDKHPLRYPLVAMPRPIWAFPHCGGEFMKVPTPMVSISRANFKISMTREACFLHPRFYAVTGGLANEMNARRGRGQICPGGWQ